MKHGGQRGVRFAFELREPHQMGLARDLVDIVAQPVECTHGGMGEAAWMGKLGAGVGDMGFQNRSDEA